MKWFQYKMLLCNEKLILDFLESLAILQIFSDIVRSEVYGLVSLLVLAVFIKEAVELSFIDTFDDG